MTAEHTTQRSGPLWAHLPEGWPDGPTDEVLGELFYAALRVQHDTDDMVKGGSSYVRLIGSFNLRWLGTHAAPYIASLLFNGPAHIVAQRLRQVLGANARPVLEAILTYLPRTETTND